MMWRHTDIARCFVEISPAKQSIIPALFWCCVYARGVARTLIYRCAETSLFSEVSQQTQNIFITFVQRRPNVFDVGPTLYTCYKNISCLQGFILDVRIKPCHACIAPHRRPCGDSCSLPRTSSKLWSSFELCDIYCAEHPGPPISPSPCYAFYGEKNLNWLNTVAFLTVYADILLYILIVHIVFCYNYICCKRIRIHNTL